MQAVRRSRSEGEIDSSSDGLMLALAGRSLSVIIIHYW
jgi:hypothetical protein